MPHMRWQSWPRGVWQRHRAPPPSTASPAAPYHLRGSSLAAAKVDAAAQVAAQVAAAQVAAAPAAKKKANKANKAKKEAKGLKDQLENLEKILFWTYKKFVFLVLSNRKNSYAEMSHRPMWWT